MPRKLVTYPDSTPQQQKGTKVVTDQFSFLSNKQQLPSNQQSPVKRASSAAYSHSEIISKSQVTRSFSDPHSLVYSTRAPPGVKSKTSSTTNLADMRLSPKPVVRRNKSPTSGGGHGNNRRRGMVFNISPPIFDPNSPKRNGASPIADQEKMLQRLLDDSQKSPNEQPVVVVNRNRMADRIQRTIRALYKDTSAKNSPKNSPQAVKKRGSTKAKKQKNRGALVNGDTSGGVVGMATKPSVVISGPVVDPDSFKNTIPMPPRVDTRF